MCSTVLDLKINKQTHRRIPTIDRNIQNYYIYNIQKSLCSLCNINYNNIYAI